MLVTYLTCYCCAHPCECSVRFTDHNLHISSSVRYLGTAQGCCYPLGVTSMTWNSNGLNVELERAFADGSVALSRRSSIPMISAICTLAHEQLELFKLKMLFTFLSCQWKIPRYLVTAGTGLSIWDLVYVSTVELLQVFAFLHGWQGFRLISKLEFFFILSIFNSFFLHSPPPYFRNIPS